MLKFIEGASQDEQTEHIDTERKEQGDFEGAVTAAAEREALGKCAEDGQPCAPDGPGRGHAECEACLEGVTVYGYCTQNPDAGGCADATATTSADALALVHKKHKK